MDSESTIYLVLSCVAVVLFVVMTIAKTRLRWVVVSALVFAVAALPWSTALSVQLGVTCVFALITRPSQAGEGWMRPVLMIVPAIVPLVTCGLPLLDREYHEVKAVRQTYPLISLDERLNYETTPISPAMHRANTEQASDDSPRNKWNHRTYMLFRAHQLTQADFVKAASFGVGRIITVHKRAIDLPELPPIPYDYAPSEQTTYQANGSVAETNAEVIPSQRISGINLGKIHEQSLENFFDPGRMGYVKDRQHVAGFLSHRFTQMPGTERPSRDDWYHARDAATQDRPPREYWRRKWAIVRLELIGTLRHKQPVAYVSDHLPQLDEIDRYPRRDLTDFERSAIERMRSNEDLVIDDQPHRIQMIGSLRAAEQCRQCHNVGPRELLGALSYELKPET